MATAQDIWEDNLARLFEHISKAKTVWRDQEQPWGTEELCTLKVINDVSAGIDETRLDVDLTKLTSSPPEELEPTQCGLRTLTLEVRVNTYNQDAGKRARFLLQRVRTRLRRPSSLAALREIDTSLIDIGPIVSSPNVLDNRAFSTGLMEVRLHTIDVERDHAFGRIAQMQVSGTVTTQGETAKTVPQFTIDLPDP